MDFSSFSFNTQAPSQRSSTGHAFAHVRGTQFDSKIVFADPKRFPVEIFLMKAEIFICVGHAFVQGES